MTYLDEFRRRDLAQSLAAAIAREADKPRSYSIMEFCGGHTHAIFRYGVQDLVPANLRFVHGPGCPVGVLPMGRIDSAMELAEKRGVILAAYGDMMRAPSCKRRSLMKAKADGADIRTVYSSRDALRIARDNPTREVVLFAIGFETTTPPTAAAIKQAEAEGLKNFSVYCNHALTPAAMRQVLELSDSREAGDLSIDGFLGPSHVSAIIGTRPFALVAETYRRPIVITGFEPLDILQATLMVVRQLNEGRHQVENQYLRVVSEGGDRKAQRLVDEVFERRAGFEWRGLGEIPESALKIRQQYASYDAECRFALAERQIADVKSCECPAILRGSKRPTDCKLFGKACTPDNPMGACMVSAEGACAAYWSYRRSAEPMEEVAA